MDAVYILLNNLVTIPIICFLFGILFSIFRMDWLFLSRAHSLLTCFLLFSIGFKGGGAFMQHSTPQFFLLLGTMIGWGFIQPFISYWFLRKFTKTDAPTAIAIAACFGSVSVMTFAAGTAFLEKLDIHYETFVIAVLAMMEVPAILSGLFISKSKKASTYTKSNSGIGNNEGGARNFIQATPESKQINSKNLSMQSCLKFSSYLMQTEPILESQEVYKKAKNLLIHTLFNKTILMIFLGMAIGIICYRLQLSYIQSGIFIIFKPCLCLFLLNMGLLIGKQRKDLTQFSWSLSLFGFYMPLIGGSFGIALSYFFGLDAGTGTLIAVLSASASYIAVPAAVKISIPEANEAIYLPLSLGVAFPFNVLIGIPVYYVLAMKLLT